MSLASQTERDVCAMPKPFRDWFAEYYHAVCSNEGRQMTHGEVYSCIATWKEALRTQTDREEQFVDENALARGVIAINQFFSLS